MSGYCTRTPRLDSMARTIEEVDQAILAASGEIDAAFASGGYLTPIDTSGLSATAATRLDALLASHCAALAAFKLGRGNAATSQQVRTVSTDVVTAAQAARAWLRQVSERTLRYEGLPASPTTGNTTALAVIGTTGLEMNSRRFRLGRFH